ncbi:unnamed protein product [Rotaria socialis]|uniref:Reverse transcriptase domain-containing protein n=1 Tax=Rotaria socialis TaxID=392032 RepID=A0A819XFT9_9BILA|nr:unnamed protein product [Rotaria socialis]CAF3296006.1 unnamed protein product [Rotaria socialis]CAF3331171.1 unnamed protein product [Rotaria socialis]CAF3699823.1 unnamed protein product [Rotaria socialis]CAF3731316.1 unnamed protein product [Rotaria socialis]
MDDWHNIGSPALHSSSLKLQCYNGNLLNVKGECHVHIQYKDKHYDLPLIVINGSSSPLLGIQWIKMMLLNLNDIVHGQNPAQSYVHKIYDAAALNTTLQKYKQLLNKELGHCTKVQAHIQLKLDAIPKFFKPRPIPFAYLECVKEEIQRNVEAGILERIDTSPWPAPIVPVKKLNGKVGTCGDFKVTINHQMLIDQHPIPSIDELLVRLNNGQKFTKLDLSDAYLQVD